MYFLSRLTIRYKLLVMVLVVGGGAVALVGFLGEQMGRAAIHMGFLREFAHVRAAKSYEIESYFDRIESPPEKLVSFLNDLFRQYDETAASHGIEKIKTIGDCYMAVSGVPSPRKDHARAMVEMALDMLRILRFFDEERGINMQVRIGINVGPVIAGVIGASKFIYDLWGDTVNLASRMESTGVPGAIQVSQSVYVLLHDEYPFEERGLIQVKGKGELPAWVLREEKVRGHNMGGIHSAA
jgi:hypothetical protein